MSLKRAGQFRVVQLNSTPFYTPSSFSPTSINFSRHICRTHLSSLSTHTPSLNPPLRLGMAARPSSILAKAFKFFHLNQLECDENPFETATASMIQSEPPVWMIRILAPVVVGMCLTSGFWMDLIDNQKLFFHTVPVALICAHSLQSQLKNLQRACSYRVCRYDQPDIMSQKSNCLWCPLYAQPSSVVVRLFDVVGYGTSLCTTEHRGICSEHGSNILKTCCSLSQRRHPPSSIA